MYQSNLHANPDSNSIFYAFACCSHFIVLATSKQKFTFCELT